MTFDFLPLKNLMMGLDWDCSTFTFCIFSMEVSAMSDSTMSPEVILVLQLIKKILHVTKLLLLPHIHWIVRFAGQESLCLLLGDESWLLKPSSVFRDSIVDLHYKRLEQWRHGVLG